MLSRAWLNKRLLSLRQGVRSKESAKMQIPHTRRLYSQFAINPFLVSLSFNQLQENKSPWNAYSQANSKPYPPPLFTRCCWSIPDINSNSTLHYPLARLLTCPRKGNFKTVKSIANWWPFVWERMFHVHSHQYNERLKKSTFYIL